MKSFCIKTNNIQIINYLLKNLEIFPLENIYFINKEFKNFKNVIIHYTGTETNTFFTLLSEIITNCILYFYEPLLLKKILNFNFFYFDNYEQDIIKENCLKYISMQSNENIKFRKEEIYTEVLKYIIENKYMILDGFVTFRLQNYHYTLEEVVDYNVNEYVIEKEYNEFINLLKMYIDSKPPETSIIYLIYNNGESVLLDKNKNLIELNDTVSNAKYLSDISFSSNDYALNALLSLLPSKIEIHLIGDEDEFINTLKLVFRNRVSICYDTTINEFNKFEKGEKKHI